MKKINFLLYLLFFSSLNLYSQTITIGTSTLISAISPHNHAFNYSIYEVIYLQSEINTNGLIQSIAFSKNDGSNLDSIENVSLYMKQTASTTLSAGTYDTTGYLLVYQGKMANNAQSGWMPIILDTPFQYDNIQNLQILFVKNFSPAISAAGVRARYQYFNSSPIRARRYNSDTPIAIGSTSLTATAVTSNLQITFAPLGPPDCPVLTSPADNAFICPADPIFSWALTGGAPATDFEFYLGTDGGGTALPTNVVNGSLTGNVLNYQYSGTLVANTTYYWSVVSLNTSGSPTGCQINSFTTGNLPPSVSLSMIPDPLQCYGDSASVAVFALGGNPPYTYLWSTGQTTSGVILGGGTYTVTVTDSISCELESPLTISQPPAIISNITSTPDSIGTPNCSGTVSANPSGGTPPFTINWSSGSTTNLCAGWYTATITDANGCTETDSVFVDFSSGMNEWNEPVFSVYPNPVKDIFIINSLREIGEINIYDLTGRILFSKVIPENKSSLDFSNLVQGVYFIKINNKTIKVIKQ